MTDPVTAIEVPAPAGTTRLDGPDVVLYPEETSRARGTYSMDGAGFIDDLVAEGDPAPLVLVLGVASAAGWDAVRLVLARRSRIVKVTAGFPDGDRTRWVQARGDGPAVADALDKTRPW
jgi:hypothetical protein